MLIQFVVISLVYLMLIVLTYEAIIFATTNEEKGKEIINASYNRAFTVLVFGLLVVYGIVIHPATDIDYQTTSILILVSKSISIITLGCSLYLLSRKSFKNTR